MKINNELLSFRYRKSFLLNRFKFKKIESTLSNIKKRTHAYCPICFGKEVDLISEVDRVGFQLDTVICKKCEFVFNTSYISNPIEYYENEFGKDRWKDPEKSFVKRTSSEAFSFKRFEFLKKTMGEDFPKIDENIPDDIVNISMNLIANIDGKDSAEHTKVFLADYALEIAKASKESWTSYFSGDGNVSNQEQEFLMKLNRLLLID